MSELEKIKREYREISKDVDQLERRFHYESVENCEHQTYKQMGPGLDRGPVKCCKHDRHPYRYGMLQYCDLKSCPI